MHPSTTAEQRPTISYSQLPPDSFDINVFYSNEDDGWIADDPDLVACSAFGKTLQDALREVVKAKTAWLEAARAERKPIPEPRYPSAHLSGFGCLNTHAILEKP